MKKKLAVVLVAAFLLSLVVLPAASAQGQAYSSISVTNLGVAAADIAIFYYNQDGSQDPASPVYDTVLAGQSNVYFPVHAADGFNGSVVIESTEAIVVVSNILYTAPTEMQSSWVGYTEGAESIVFPLVMKANNSNDTSFNVQNTTGEEIDITIEFVAEPGKGYPAISDVSDKLPPWSAHTYDQRTMGEFSLIAKWVGSVKVTVDTDGEIAGVGQIFNTDWQAVTAYGAFPVANGVATASLSPSPVVNLPLIMDNNTDMWTSINCMNLGPGATQIDVDFTPEAGFGAKASELRAGVPENGNAVFLQSRFGAAWVGGAEVTNTADNDLACVVNQVNQEVDYFSSYEGFNADELSDEAVAPGVQYQPKGAGNANWTSLNVQNLSGSGITFMIDWLPEPGQTDIPDTTGVAVADGAVGVVFLFNPYGDGTTKWVGGAKVSVESPVAGDKIAVVVNLTHYGLPGDFYASYDALPIMNGP